MKIIITVIVTAVVLGGLYAGGQWWLWKKAAAEAQGTSVRIEPAKKGDLVEIVSSPGIIQPDERVSISARVSARIAELPIKECDPVKKDDVLIVLDNKDLKAQLKQSEARKAAQEAQIKVSESKIESAKAQIVATQVGLMDAKRDLDRQKKLLASSDVSQSTVDTAQAKVDRVEAELNVARENLEADRRNLTVMQHNLEAAAADITRADDNLSYATIKSPIDGVVTKLNAKVGEVVMTGTMNNPGTVILEVANMSRMLMVARVDETSVANVQIGQKAIVRAPAYPDKLFEGRVHTVALAHTDDRDGTKYYKVEVLLNTDGKRIQSGLTADVDIETKRHQNVIKVPSQTVLGRSVDSLPVGIRDQAEVDKKKTMAPVVYRLVDGKAIVTPVKIGASDIMYTIIESGLNPGDPIVVGPYKVLESIQHDQKLKEEKAATTQPTTRPAALAAK